MRVPAIVLPILVTTVAALAPMALRAQARPAQSSSLIALLAAAASYLETYEQKFSAIVAEEQYTQTTRAPSGKVLLSAEPSRRDLKSDLMMLNLGDSDWTQFRDVYEVDNMGVRDHESRLQKLFEKPSAGTMSQAQRIADESASYNVGVTRNINVPTMALTYLWRDHQDRSSFQLAGSEAIDGERTQVVRFKETAKPPLIRTPQGSIATSGRFWIVPATGDVVRTELTCVLTGPRKLTGTTTVEYELQPALGLRVPTQMDEEYDRAGGETDRGHATYSNFRAFTVDTKTVKRGGGGERGSGSAAPGGGGQPAALSQSLNCRNARPRWEMPSFRSSAISPVVHPEGGKKKIGS